MNLLVVLIYSLEIFPSLAKKTTLLLKLESASPTYVNTKLIDYKVNVVPHNKSINVYNQTIMFKFDASTENILLVDSSSYRITKNNRTFQISQFVFPFKETITMERMDTGTMWRDYTRPPLIWPPQVNVTYRTFGWAPDMSKYPSVVPSGGMKILTTIRFPNRTKVFGSQWIVSLWYE